MTTNESNQELQSVIAVVTDAFAPFHRDVLESIEPHFSSAGFGTLGVAGRDVRTDRLLEAAGGRQGSYRGAFGTHLDVRGAVVVCGATHPSMTADAIAEYIGRLTDGPVVSLGIELPGVPSVLIDWPTGIDQLMTHVLAEPARQRFAFVRGFPGDPHSEMREAGFRRALGEAGLAVDEALIVSGNFSIADARNAVAGLLARGERFDGLIAANDDMAVGALAAIQAHGMVVPRDVIVAGFDDALCSVTSYPTLTTVLLDTAQLTKRTADLVLSAIASGEVLPPDTRVRIGTELLVRDSTGEIPGRRDESTRPRLDQRWERSWAPAWLDVDDLVTIAVSTLTTGNDGLVRRFEQLCAEAEASPNRIDIVWLRHAWRELHALLDDSAESDDANIARAITLDHLGAIDRLLHPIEVRHRTELTAHRQLQERLVMRLASCADTSALWDTLRKGLRSLGMLNAWVVTHADVDSASDAEPSDSMQLLFDLGNEDVDGNVRFDAMDILPSDQAGLLEHDMHVLVPLRAGESDIGYMVVEPRGEYLLELEAIASGIAQVLRHLRQVAVLEGQAARLQEANEALDRLASQDTLTGLANRKLFLTRLQDHVAENKADASLAMVFLDLDGFKQINDTLGHAAGDQLLRVIAGRLSDVISDSDTLARFGGDEFTIIVYDVSNPNRVIDVANRALEAAATPALLDGHEVSVSASLGIATFPLDGATAEDLMRNADIAMYAAKEAGRNRFEVYCDLVDDASTLA